MYLDILPKVPEYFELANLDIFVLPHARRELCSHMNEICAPGTYPHVVPFKVEYFFNGQVGLDHLVWGGAELWQALGRSYGKR